LPPSTTKLIKYNFIQNLNSLFRHKGSGVGAGDATAFPSKFFRQIWSNLANLGNIWANLGKIWVNLDKLGKIWVNWVKFD